MNSVSDFDYDTEMERTYHPENFEEDQKEPEIEEEE